MTDRNYHIPERIFGPVILTERTAVISERPLLDPVRLEQRTAIINERIKGPVHIFGQDYDPDVPPVFFIVTLSFTVTRTAITAIFTTSEAAGCQVDGGEYPGLITDWFTDWTLHGTAHSHQKTGLTEDTEYGIRIGIRNGAGLTVWSPSVSGYYVVKTANAGGTGGGLAFTIWS